MTDYSKMTDEELIEAFDQRQKDIAGFDNMQKAAKVQLNSAYGALGSEFCRFYDIRQATAITCSGQLVIRILCERINNLLNKMNNNEEPIDYVIASDTDSLYLRLDDFMRHELKTRDEKVDFICQLSDEVIVPYMNRVFKDIYKSTNAYEQKMHMKRETISDKGIWTAKKRYMLNVLDDEGLRLSVPKQKIMGNEAVRSTTPKICREAVKETIRIILNEDEKAVQAYIAKFKKQYFNSSFEDMACPSGINGLQKYYSRDSIYRKGTPIHVKGALIYNHYIDKLGLEKKYQKVNEGEKIKFSYLKKPNHLQIEVISCHGELPKEFDLTKDIDYDRMFFKTYLKPIDKILDLLGWESEKKATLFD